MRHALAILLLSMAFAGCSMNEPVNIVSQDVPSPDKTKRVVVFCRDAGATTVASTQVSVLDTGEKLGDGPGNAAIIDHGSAGVTWKPDGKLLVTLERSCRVFKKESQVKGVPIEYREK